MFSIGEFAQLGRVSVRMLRHYDAIGLLQPAHVDPASGHRFYQADQLSRLNRVIALKDLGFTLHQVSSILDGRIDTAELYGMVRLRRAELEERIATDTARLLRVEVRLKTIAKEGHMHTDEVLLKRIPRRAWRSSPPSRRATTARTSAPSSSRSSATCACGSATPGWRSPATASPVTSPRPTGG
ncbi:helix-turn-helix domain-containing protein [Streptosporangium lutulentum]